MTPGFTPGSAVTALGFVVGALVLWLEGRRRGMVTEGMGWVALAGLCGGVLAAKGVEWLLSGRELLAAHPEALADPRMGGRTILGGVLGGWLSVVLAKRALGIRRSTGDAFALALAAGEAVGRIGCFLNGCCYGVAGAVPWAVFQHGQWRHPAQLYSAAAAAAIFAVLVALRGRLPREGDLFRSYLILWGLSRLALEFFREHAAGPAGWSLAQWTGLALAGFGAAALLRRPRQDAVAA